MESCTIKTKKRERETVVKATGVRQTVRQTDSRDKKKTKKNTTAHYSD